MRILFTACPFFGHVNTVLPLALAAQRAGHEVAVATGADFASHVGERELTAWPIGPTSAEAGTPRSPAHFFYTAAQRAADLLPLTAAWLPDLVVSEEMELAGAIAAACSARWRTACRSSCRTRALTSLSTARPHNGRASHSYSTAPRWPRPRSAGRRPGY
jgi:UDP:flavonoid glycosyltransferase YjiC (YdhE family)